MLVDPKKLMDDAARRGYAIAGFNTPSHDAALAVIGAAEELGLPVMLGLAEVHQPDAPIELLGPMLHFEASRAKVPIILHVDHGQSMDFIYKAIRCGFTSVMYDCSALPLEENARKVGDFAKMAHAMGIIVEGEVGLMPSTFIDGKGCVTNGVPAENIEQYFSKPEDVAYFVRESGVDMMAISFGNVHGNYIGEPKLHIDLLQSINAVAGAHLVMHGTTGVDDVQIRQAIDGGIRKFNYFTGLATAPDKPLRDLFAKAGDEVFIQEVAHCARDAMRTRAMEVIRLFRNGVA